MENRKAPHFLQHADYFAILLQILLLSIGVLFIYGTGVEIGGEFAKKWYRQLMWIGAGTLAYFSALLIDYRRLGKYAGFFYLFSLLLLCSLFVFGHKINGARSWIILPGLGQMQPSELAKPCTLLFAAWAGSRQALRNSMLPQPVAILLAILPPVLLIGLQPDYGTALVFLPFATGLILLSGLKWRYLIACFLLAIAAIPVGYQMTAPHQRERIKVFLEAPAHAFLAASKPLLSENANQKLQQKITEFFAIPDGKMRDNWNAEQSLLAVGSGGTTGKGYLQGTHHVLGYLPKTVAPTDFIFSVIAEETGFLGSVALLILLLCLILCFCRTALLARNHFGAGIALGAALILATHVIINIGMTVQAAPIIGIPLPYVSYGGSFMLSTMLLAGLVQNVHIHRRIPKDPREDSDNDNEE